MIPAAHMSAFYNRDVTYLGVRKEIQHLLGWSIQQRAASGEVFYTLLGRLNSKSEVNKLDRVVFIVHNHNVFWLDVSVDNIFVTV